MQGIEAACWAYTNVILSDPDNMLAKNGLLHCLLPVSGCHKVCACNQHRYALMCLPYSTAPRATLKTECCAGGAITDLVSFYTLPSTVLGNDKYNTLKAAFMYYTVAAGTPLHQLMNDALILAHQTYAEHA